MRRCVFRNFWSCKRTVERDTLLDKEAVGYAQKLEVQCQAHPHLRCSEQPPSMTDALPQGWALKSSTSKRARFIDKQRKFIVDKFQQGESSGRKIDPASVARSMLTAVDARGNRILSSVYFRTASQIAAYFSRQRQLSLVEKIMRRRWWVLLGRQRCKNWQMSLLGNFSQFTLSCGMREICVKWFQIGTLTSHPLRN